ncbi:MAG: methyltransferase protein [Clostridiaceae bacterium]|jgi:SAM-dependent methyltransferase|nr:methyltransferase protein [Clostridiaceae bacterium]
MATFNTRFYKGEVEYSDGEIEKELRGIVEQDLDLEGTLNTDNRWPIFYHLSHLRRNIINWYPFSEKASILEVGSGCGAITDILCEKARHVVSVELTKVRAEINFLRNKGFENLDIFVGNINNMQFNKKFDYIILNGVFEYAIAFTKTQNPYVDFLTKLKDFLKPDGKIIVAIENRLGLKYLSGAKEDHTGIIFDGINGYKNVNHVRTFSKSEIIKIISDSGINNFKFYYPYPDYKFPEYIYTDEGFELIPLSYDITPFDSDRLELYNEKELVRTLVKEKVCGTFSNSFLIEMSMLPSDKKNEILFAKISSNRRKDMRIATVIERNEEGELWVVKYPENHLAEKHIEHIFKIYEMSKKLSSIPYIPLKRLKKGIACKYLHTESLKDKLIKFVDDGDFNGFLSTVREVYTAIDRDSRECNNIYTDAFKTVFGDAQFDYPLRCSALSNIDIIFDNLLIDNNEYCIIDYEWTFNIDIPILFIFWRALHIFYYTTPRLIDMISYKALMSMFNISEDMTEVFCSWADYFSKEFIKSNEYKNIRKQVISADINNIFDTQINEHIIYSSLYIDEGNGYNEQSKLYVKCTSIDGYYVASFDLSKINNIKSIRFDPIEGFMCSVKLRNIETDIKDLSICNVNSYLSYTDYYEFFNTDPRFEFSGAFNQSNYVNICFEISKYTSDYLITKLVEINQENTKNIGTLVNQQTISDEINHRYDSLFVEKSELKREFDNVVSEKAELKREFDNVVSEKAELKREFDNVVSDNEELKQKLTNLYNSKVYRILKILKKGNKK